MDDEVEARVRERREVTHIALHRPNLQTVALGDQAVLGELLVGKVEHRDVRGRRGEDRTLLPAAGSETEDVPTFDVAEPRFGYRGGRHVDVPVALAGGFDLFRGEGLRVGAFAFSHALVPGAPVVGDCVHACHLNGAGGAAVELRQKKSAISGALISIS